jgi:3-hydroxybutyryl-CoA dehydrogenase
MTTTVGVVGAGTMGAGIAQVALEAGESVLLHDPDPEALSRAIARVRDGLERRRRRGHRDASGPTTLDVDETLSRLAATPELDTLAVTSDLVIEAALEDLSVKRAIFARLDASARPSTILATNTSALSVEAIAVASVHPGRVIGLHFFNPAPLMALVEVVETGISDPAVVERAIRLMAGWGKTPVRTADSPGFIVNRVNRPFTLEALRMLELGLGSVEDIDGAVRAAGFPMGPFQLMDLVGIDVNLASARGIFEAFHYEPRFRPSVIQERLVEAGRFGRKTGEGFYWYGEDGRSLGMAAAFVEGPGVGNAGMATAARLLVDGEPAPGRPAADAAATDLDDPIVERIVLAVVNEAYRAVGDGVATVADVDLALRLGAGHPRGPFEQEERAGGPRAVLARLERIGALRVEVEGRFDPAPGLIEAAANEP